MESVSKLDAAKRHIEEAIRLFFENRDALVIHTIAAAAQGTLRDIARAEGAERLSMLHDHPHIRPEHRAAWIRALNSPRNFFKHADNDPKGTLQFDESLNVSLLLDAVILYGTVTKAYLSAASVFMGWFTTKHPEMRGAISPNQIGDYCVRNEISPDDLDKFLELIDAKILIEPVRR